MKPIPLKPTDEMRLHLTLPRPIWKELSLMAIAQDKNIKRVTVECIQKYIDSVPLEERVKSISSAHPPRSGPVLRGTYALAEKKKTSEVSTANEASPESVQIPEQASSEQPQAAKPKPNWPEIWTRLKDHLYEQPAWDELQTYLKGTTPPNDFLQWKLDRQIAWLNAYVPLEQQ